MADLFLGKLKALGDRIEKVGDVAVTGVKTVGTTVGTGVISLAKDIKDGILDSDLDRIRSVHQFQKQQDALAGPKRKQVTEKELTAADQRADAVLARLPPGYFDKEYDPVRQELSQLTDTSGPDDIDQIVERLGTCVEAVSGKLSRHVMKKRDQLIVGIDVVASVEDDLKAALAGTRTGRSMVRTAGEEVQRHLRVAGQTRKKQTCMQVMEVLAKIKQAKDLQKLLRRAQEGGEYHTAILLCVQCFQGVESIRELKVSGELLATVQRLYVDTLHKLDGALTAICGQFDSSRYTKVLDAYLLQGVSGATLAERVLQSFRDAVNDTTARAVKSILLMQPQLVSRLAGGSASLEGSFLALCNALPHSQLLPALTQVMEVCLAVLASYHAMALWHVECLRANKHHQQQQQDTAAGSAGGDGPAAADDDASAATLAILATVSDMMAASRVEVLTTALNRVMAVVRLPAATAGTNLLQVAEHCHRFLSVGEAFCGCELAGLRDSLGGVLGGAFEAFHHANMQTLSALMQSEEAWRNVGGPCLAHEVAEGSLLHLAQLAVPPRSMDGQAGEGRDFEAWMAGGSPFQPLAPLSASFHLAPGSATSSPAPTPPRAPAPPASPPTTTPVGSEGGAQQPQQQPQQLQQPQVQQQPQVEQQQQQQVQQLLAHGPMMTPAGRHMLGCLKAYCLLYRGLGRARAGTVWEATTQLLDRFVVATFMLLSGISIDALVMQDDVVTFRLQRALLRILSADGSRYKAHIEELQRLKAAQSGARRLGSPAQATGISWLDRFGNTMESLVNDLDRSVNKLSAAIGDKVPGLDAAAVNAALGNSLQERVVAGESLAIVAGEVRAARAAVMHVLQGASAAVKSGAVLPPRSPSPAPPAPSSSPSPAPAPPPGDGNYGFTTLTPPRTSSVKLQYQGMQTVLAQQQQQHQQGSVHGSPAVGASHHTPAGSEGGAPHEHGEPSMQSTPQGPPAMPVTSAGTARDADAYFARVVEAVFDLREALLQGGARALLGRLLDPERGVVAAIAAVTAYGGRDPPTRHNAWADAVGQALHGYAAALATRQDMPQMVQDQLWLSALTLISDALTTGFSRVKKCTLEGRAAMSMDLSAVERVVRVVLPPGVAAAGLATLKRADGYVRALYLPWDEFARWCQLHFAEYGLWRLLPLIEQAADVHRVKRQHKAELLELLDCLTRDF